VRRHDLTCSELGLPTRSADITWGFQRVSGFNLGKLNKVPLPGSYYILLIADTMMRPAAVLRTARALQPQSVAPYMMYT
jgi:hypothetical protein